MNPIHHALTGPLPPARALYALASAMASHAMMALRPIWPARGHGRAELQAMSDLELRDLGLGRSEIGHVFVDGRSD